MKQLCPALVATLLCAAAGYSQSTSVTLNTAPSKAVGQPPGLPTQGLLPESSNPDLVEGRELFNPSAITFDTSVNPPIVYVSDLNNNRVLAWKNATSFTNGQAADLVIGQMDKFSTANEGPGTTFSTGFNSPLGIAVYKSDLYVVDSNNNRILRFPKPFAQTTQYPLPDLVIGQSSLNSKTVNYPGTLGAQGFSTAGFPQAALAFDSSGNLWMVDPGNRRVLMFPVATLCSGCSNAPMATIEIGQPSATINYATGLGAGTPNGKTITNQFAVPLALAFDPAGNLYVADTDPGNPGGFSRVLVFLAPFSNGMSATRIMGVVESAQITSLTTAQQQNIYYQTQFSFPEGLFFLGDSSVGVVDSADNRIMIFPPYANWPDPGTYISPQADGVIGQTAYSSFGANGTTLTTALTPPASAGSLWLPAAATFLASTNELFIADTNNNRVLVMPENSGPVFGNATRVLGQYAMNMQAINLIEGREFAFLSFSNSGTSAGAGIALDTNGTVPHLYVADPFNNRVLGFYDSRKIAPGSSADIVIGQQTFNTGLCNYPTGDTAQPTQSSLCEPTDVLVDAAGNLYVADGGNGRVVRFPAPFANYPTLQTLEKADLVLGQQSFTISITDPSSTNMAFPSGLAFSGTNGLLVSDLFDNRVLYIPFSANGTFAAMTDNGKAATKVFGQTNFTAITAGSTASKLNSPHHISADSSGQLYVADTNNNRVLIFSDPAGAETPTTGATSLLSLPGLSSPFGVYVNPSTGEVWVANASSATCVRYPQYQLLVLNPAPTGSVTAAAGVLAVLQDQYGDLFVADATNRVAVYFQGLEAVNAATFLTLNNIAPGMLASIFSVATATQFGSANVSQIFQNVPLPTTLNGVQVLVNGTAAPLFYAGQSQINVQVPSSAPDTGTADVQVVQASTGQVLGAGTLNMNTVSPGLFRCPDTQTALLQQACVLNQDNTVNSGSNPAPRGTIISFYATGQGAVPNEPTDGTLSSGTSSTVPAGATRVFIAPTFVDEVTKDNPTCALTSADPQDGSWIKYSGLAPGLVGVWQINVQIPYCIAPGAQVPVLVYLDNVPSDNAAVSGYTMTIAVK